MSQQNLYMNLYLNNLNKTKQTVSKDYLFALAINLGQVHNVLGVMISDIVNLMGNLSFKQQQQKSQLYSHLRNTKFSEPQIKTNNKYGQKQPKIQKQTKSNQYIPEKMEIENLPSDHYNDKMKSDQVIKKQFLFNEFQFNQKNQLKDTSNEPPKKKVFSSILYQFEQKNHEQNKKQEKQEDKISSKTISPQKVRYNQKYENQFQRENEKNIKFQVKVKEVKEKNNAKKKQKSIFSDLFDSSQTNSNPQQEQDVIQKFSPISQQKQYNSNTYYTKQTIEKSNSNSNNFLKPKTIGYSTQIKNDKIKCFAKPYNLLEQTFFVNSSKSNLINIEEIDQIETSHKKVPEKIIIKKKNDEKKGSVKSNDNNFDEYIPRREDIGRKKINRENAKGSQCPDCKAFYDAIGEDSKGFKNICECTSRHKSSTIYMNKHTVQNYSQAFSLD